MSRFTVIKVAPFVLSLVILSSFVFAQITRFPSNSSQSTDRRRVTIKGTVINSVTSEPIRRALVTLNGASPASAFTDDEGHFSFPGVIDGYLHVEAQRPGFFAPTERFNRFIDTTKSTDIQIKLVPAGLIYGRVTGASDEPLERVPVQLFTTQIVNGRRGWIQSTQKQTDADGGFRFASLHPGSYKIAAGPTRDQDLDALTSGYPLSYFPDAPTRDSASAIQLQPAQQVEANFKLHSVPLFKVSGKIIGPATRGAAIEFLDSSNSHIRVPVRFDPADGTFEAPAVPAGRYVLRASSTDDQQRTFRARTTLDVTSNITSLVLALHEPITIPITTRTNFSKPAPEMRTPDGVDTPLQMAANVSLISVEDGNSYYTQPDGPPQKGSMSIRDVEPGTYYVEIIPLGPWYVSAAQSGSTNLLREQLVLSAAGRVNPIEITLRDDFGQVEGTVRGATAPGTLVAVPDGEPNRNYPGFFSEDGLVRFPLIAPGSYYFYAFDTTEQIEYSNPEALAPYRSKAVRVNISPNQTAKVTLDVIGTEQ
jgi:hypothetical protein